MSIQTKVLYRRSKDYHVIAASGAVGGPSPSAEIVFDLYVERFALPEEETLIIDETTGTPLPSNPVDTPVIRESQVGIMMRPDIAYNIGRWLQERARFAGFRPPEDDQGIR